MSITDWSFVWRTLRLGADIVASRNSAIKRQGYVAVPPLMAAPGACRSCESPAGIAEGCEAAGSGEEGAIGMRAGEMLRRLERMLAASQGEAVAVSREVRRRQWLLEALRTVIEAG